MTLQLPAELPEGVVGRLQLLIVVAEQDDGGPTATFTELTGEEPPGPLHSKEKAVLAVRGSVSPLPESVPELDHGPLAVQLVALVELHVRVERSLYATGLGEAVMLAVGGGEVVGVKGQFIVVKF